MKFWKEKEREGRRLNEPFGGHILNFNASNSDLQTRRVRILNSRILIFFLLHLLVHHGGRLLDDVVEENCGSFASAHSLNRPEVDVQEILNPREARELEDFEGSGDVEVLGAADDELSFWQI
jgi:hypothetical protein